MADKESSASATASATATAPRLMTVAEFAKEIGVHRNTLRRYLREGIVPYYRFHNSIRINPSIAVAHWNRNFLHQSPDRN